MITTFGARLVRHAGRRLDEGAVAVLSGAGYDFGSGPAVLRVDGLNEPAARRALAQTLVRLESRSLRSPSWLTVAAFPAMVFEAAAPTVLLLIDRAAPPELAEVVELLEELGWSALVACERDASAAELAALVSAGLVPALRCTRAMPPAAVADLLARTGLRSLPVLVDAIPARAQLAAWRAAGAGLVVTMQPGVGADTGGDVLRTLAWTPDSAEFVEHLTARDAVAALRARARVVAPRWLHTVRAR